MTMESQIFTFALFLVTAISLYWFYLDFRERKEMEERDLKVKRNLNEERREKHNSQDGDYSHGLSFYGLILGGWIGYLLRPSFTVLGREIQPSFEEIITIFAWARTETHADLSSRIATEVAYKSVEYMLTGALIGFVLGWLMGKHTRRKSN